MVGAEPMYITAGFILEEGLHIHVLRKIVESMQQAAHEANIKIIAGDTKVVQKNKADGIYINTTGVGFIPPNVKIGGSLAKPGDRVILSGTIGDHGIAVLQARNELEFDSDIKSDVAPLNNMVRNLLKNCNGIHVLRDPTRGGLATSLIEIAIQSQICIEIEEQKIPISSPVHAACEMLGFDPLYIANEGKVIAIVDPKCEETALLAMRSSPYGVNAQTIGTVLDSPKNRVLLRTNIGTRRVLDMLSGELLPRIC
jgi:hydrogenase expression/formation protein HypE